MNPKDGISFILILAEEIKRSYEFPVILLNFKDYTEIVLNSLNDLRTALLRQVGSSKLINIVHNSHLVWLQFVQELECLKGKNNTEGIPREMYIKAVSFTIECIHSRYNYFKQYVEQVKLEEISLNKDRYKYQIELKIIKAMSESVERYLLNKQNSFQKRLVDNEYIENISMEIDRHLDWVDWLNSNLAIKFSKLIELQTPDIQNELVNTVRNFVTGSTIQPTESNLQQKDKRPNKLRYLIHLDATHDLEINKINEILDIMDKVEMVNNDNAAEILVLQCKKSYLKERLRALEQTKMSLNKLAELQPDKIFFSEDIVTYKEFRIFNHTLSSLERCRLVELLMKLWEKAIYCETERLKSIISILSVADMKEVFEDSLGQFTVDTFGRKVYSKDDDDTQYQVDETNSLVPICDDEKHVYFYDECGRYYLGDNNERIHQAHGQRSEYTIESEGLLQINKEVTDGSTYQFDNLGKYYLTVDGKRIYVDDEGEYEHDGLGNLIRIKEELDYITFPPKSLIPEECLYLKQVVGMALKESLAKVIINQPSDPIKYLAECLEHYKDMQEKRQKRADEQKIMIKLCKERLAAEERSLVYCVSIEGESESTLIDYNMKTYKTIPPDDYF